MRDENKTSNSLDATRLGELASIIPLVDEEAPEITPEQAGRARLAHKSHPEWFCSASKDTE